MITATDVGSLVRIYRKKRGLSQRKLADICGLSRDWIIEFERGKPKVQLDLVLRVFNALEIPFPGYSEDSQDLMGHIIELLGQSEKPQEIWNISDLLFSLTEKISQYLESVPLFGDTPESVKEDVSAVIAFNVAGCGVKISNALLKYATLHKGALDCYLETEEEWPVTMSVNPHADIRCVSRNVSQFAADLYKPLTSGFGKVSGPSFRFQTNCFGKLAGFFSDFVTTMMGAGPSCRRLGLPWALDYVEKEGVRMIADFERDRNGMVLNNPPSRQMDKCQRKEWFAAMRYCIYLVLAPNSMRDRLRKSWRDFRLQVLKRFKAANPGCRRLADFEVATPFKEGWKTVDDFDHCLDVDADSVESWAMLYLRYDVEKIFGDCTPLIHAGAPKAVKKIMDETPGDECLAFERCVILILEKFPCPIKGKREEKMRAIRAEIRPKFCGKLPDSEPKCLTVDTLDKVMKDLKVKC